MAGLRDGTRDSSGTAERSSAEWRALALLAALSCGACGSDPAQKQEPIGNAGSEGTAAGAGSPSVAAGSGATGGTAGSPSAAGTVGAAPVAGRGAEAGRAAASSGGRRAAGMARAGESGGAPAGAGASAAGSSATDGASGGGGASSESCQPDTRTPQIVPLTGNLGTHDPAWIKDGDRYYLFHTGRGIPTKTSNEMKAWQAGPPVFNSNPGWIAQQVQGATDLWAPDISFFGGKFHLYYSASTFGSNHSCIGHATRASLSSGSWNDEGSVICSNAGSNDNWNAIDPQAIVDEQGAPWLTFGSFWSGIKLIPLDEAGKRKGSELIALATRTANGGAIEAPFIVRHCGYFYLFSSIDNCCKGADSTYKIMVGRSSSVMGPYADKAGTALLRGGGTLLVQGDNTWKGPGHNAVIVTNSGTFNAYHAYAASNGASILRISEIVWGTDGWPVSAGP